jgi:predicted DCC family thiol-disulfide oxidoreductase YuxK
MMADPSPLLLFDGVCNLCASSVQFVLKHDHRRLVRFSSIQSEAGSKLYREHGFDPEQPQSMLLITDYGSFTQSDAAIELAQLMGGWLSAAVCFKIVPRPIRDAVYLLIAKNRYRIFGKKDQCWLPRPEWKERFVS